MFPYFAGVILRLQIMMGIWNPANILERDFLMNKFWKNNHFSAKNPKLMEIIFKRKKYTGIQDIIFNFIVQN